MAKSAAFSSGDAGSIRTTRHTQVEDFCYITDNTYQHGQVLEMEREVLKTLGFNLSTPTAKTFLLRFLKAAESTPGDKLDCLASFLAELTLLEYSFLPYKPSMVAASAVMLALHTLNRPAWTTTLEHYAVYTTQDLKPCVLALHQVCARSPSLLCALCLEPSRRRLVSRRWATAHRIQVQPCACLLHQHLFHIQLRQHCQRVSRVMHAPAPHMGL